MALLSLDSFTKILGTIRRNMGPTEHAVLERAAAVIEREARAEIGHLQTAVGHFPAWPSLAATTIEGYKGFPGKAGLGFSPPDYDPLLRTGEMRDSIKSSVSGRELRVGSDLDIAVWHELGTAKMPARSFLGRAAFVTEGEVGRMVGRTMVDLLMGRAAVTTAIHAGTRDVTPP